MSNDESMDFEGSNKITKENSGGVMKGISRFFRCIRVLPVCIIIFYISGCETQQFKNTATECEKLSYKKYPVITKSYIKKVKKYTYKNVPNGGTRCEEGRNSITGKYVKECKPSYDRVKNTYYVNETKYYDANKKIRDKSIDACTEKKCINTYGNKECYGNSIYSDNSKKKSLDVTKEQLEETGLTLTEYANYMRNNNGERPPPKKNWKEKACSATGLC
tara:strand:+ start:1902 stop:2558 length:657 start_codon:yes stop_codon:yes gene_type:complete